MSRQDNRNQRVNPIVKNCTKLLFKGGECYVFVKLNAKSNAIVPRACDFLIYTSTAESSGLLHAIMSNEQLCMKGEISALLINRLTAPSRGLRRTTGSVDLDEDLRLADRTSLWL